MKILSSTNVEYSRPSRNFLYLTEQRIVDRYRAMVAHELKKYLSTSELHDIKLTPVDDLYLFHTNLGAAIRNEYELWSSEHEVTSMWYIAEKMFPLSNELPNVPAEVAIDCKIIRVQNSTIAHIDEHPCHPDNFSMSCIRELWENLQ
jgi:hypothetical protein